MCVAAGVTLEHLEDPRLPELWPLLASSGRSLEVVRREL